MEEIVQRAIAEIDRRVSELGWDFEGYLTGITGDPVKRAYQYRTIKNGEPFKHFDVLVENMTRDMALAVEKQVFTIINQTPPSRLRWKLANPKLQSGRYYENAGRATHNCYVLYVAY